MLSTTNYVIAGGFNFLGQVNRRLPEYEQRYNIKITKTQLKNCFSKILSKSLLSFGTGINKNTKIIKNSVTYCNNIKKSLSLKYRDMLPQNFEIFLDSGGYQVSMGYLEKKEVFKFIDMYIKFLEDNSTLYNYAFSLDIPPNEITFDSYEDIYAWNKRSYSAMKQLPKNVLEKIIYVYHFRTPKVNKIWTDMLFEEGLAQELSIKRWSVGGVVAGLKGEDEIPYISYSIPLTIILAYIKKYTVQKYLHFHILGGSTYRDIMFYEICKIFIKKEYDIDIMFTFDSSGLFKQLMMGRFLDVLQDDFLVSKLFLTSNMLDIKNRNFGNKSNREKTYDILDEISTEYEMPCLRELPIYDGDSLNKLVELYLCLYMLHFYYKLQIEVKSHAKNLYDLFTSNREQFEKEIFDYLHRLNRGVISKRLKSKSTAFSRSLDLIGSLDVDKCNILIDKYMSKDEFKKLVRKIPTF